MFSGDDMQAMRGAAAVDADGTKIGTVDDVYLDDASGQPAWATIASGLFGTRVRFVPLGGARLNGRHLVVPFGKDAVLAAPHVAEDEHLSAEEEAVLYAHYGVSRPAPADAPADEVAPETPAAPVPLIAAAVALGNGDGMPDDEALREAEAATAAAHQAALKADPIGDGSYAGDATKSSLVNTADLEAHDHHVAPASAAPRASAMLNQPLFQADDPADEATDAEASLPEGVTAAEVAAADRQAEQDSEAAEAKWAVAHGQAVADPESDL